MNKRDRYDSLFKYYGGESGVDWLLLKAQAMQESELNPNAKSRVGALGLSQFMPATWADMVSRWTSKAGDLIDPRDPEDAICGQALYMAWLMRETQSIELALASYNAGLGRIRRTPPEKWPLETKEYAPRILRIYAQLQGERAA